MIAVTVFVTVVIGLAWAERRDRRLRRLERDYDGPALDRLRGVADDPESP